MKTEPTKPQTLGGGIDVSRMVARMSGQEEISERSLLLNAESVQPKGIIESELFPCRNNTENEVEIAALIKNLKHSIKTQIETETITQPQNDSTDYIEMKIKHKVPNLKSKPNDFWYKGVKYSLTASEYELAECIYQFMFQHGETDWN